MTRWRSAAAALALLTGPADVGSGTPPGAAPHQPEGTAVGHIKSSSPADFVVVLDRAMNVRLPKGTELRFVLAPATQLYDYWQRTAPASAVRFGGPVTVRYRERNDTLVAQEVRLRLNPTGSRMVYPMGRSTDPAGTEGGFTFADLRVQVAEEEGSPGAGWVRSGERLYVAYSVRLLRQAQGPIVFNHTIGPVGRPVEHSRYTERAPIPSASTRTAYAKYPYTLTRKERTEYVVDASVTLDGATQRRTLRFTVYP